MLPDLLAPDLKLVFCGTAASRQSAARGHYYAGPGNRFWPLLYETGLTPRRFTPQDDALLPALGFGLTDLAKGVSGMDRDIPPTAYSPQRLREILDRFRPKRLAFTSLTAAKIALGTRLGAGRHSHPALPDLPVWVLPSPSGAARGSFSSQPWYDLAEHCRSDI